MTTAPTEMFSVNYQKRKNINLFSKFQTNKRISLSSVQNYVPIYDRFFSLNNTNYNSINLNHLWSISDIKEKEKEKERQRNADVLGHKARNYHHLHQNQRPRSGVKAVFVDGSGSRTGSGGTGVFLPRGHGTVVESRKKSGCSTVIIPARVVEALKVHFGGRSPRESSRVVPLRQTRPRSRRRRPPPIRRKP